MGEFVVITGLSGAGRSLAADDLEDLGWFVIDNLPPELVPKVVELAQTPGSQVGRVALVMGTGHYQDEILPTLAWLRSTGARVRVLFLEASTDTLVRRYESSRRRHPQSSEEPGDPDGAGVPEARGEPVLADDVGVDRVAVHGRRLTAQVPEDVAGAVLAGDFIEFVVVVGRAEQGGTAHLAGQPGGCGGRLRRRAGSSGTPPLARRRVRRQRAHGRMARHREQQAGAGHAEHEG